ncbi:hypothetical protein HAHE_15600 [Haloferula helveola]|uniref:TIR domain-containing protein n=1 Tax=Haloferula helveola TaxID=490095 RepID=A0ABN6H206_9BACT|nr:hypothetical protein HAHE_15600 [Haloferula helveola]
MSEPYRIFFSHGGDDKYIVDEFLAPKIRIPGASVFLDTGKIEYGDDFRTMILRELARCDELLVLFTKSSLQRPWVLAEVGATLIREKRIVPIRYGPSDSELQKLGLMSLLGNSTILNLEDFDTYISQLKNRVNGGSDV